MLRSLVSGTKRHNVNVGHLPFPMAGLFASCVGLHLLSPQHDCFSGSIVECKSVNAASDAVELSYRIPRLK